jgi:nitric oxide reductase NorQ protein
MMLTEETAAAFGVEDRTDALQSIRGGARYLAHILKRIPADVSEPDRTAFALATYNMGLGHLLDARRFTRAGGSDWNRWVHVRPMVKKLADPDFAAQSRHGYARGGETVWQDGPVTRAVRQGAVLYLDEIAEAREDVIVVVHPLSDHRRQLFIDRHDESLTAPPEFMLVVSFNPGYRRGLKELKPSTRQRFVALHFDYPPAEVEAEVVRAESGVEAPMARKLVALAARVRALEEPGLAETVSTRLLVGAARLMRSGLNARVACAAAVVQPLTDDPDTARALQDLVDLAF